MDSLKGELLIAGAGIFGAVFRQTVVLVVEHDDSSALGFVVNRPSGLIAGEAADELARLPLPDPRIYLGGPVQQGAVAVLGEFEHTDFAGNLVFGSVGMLGAGPEGIVTESVTRAKVFSGYAGWGPGQLENEMEEGSWIVTEPTTDLVFDVEPDEMWKEALRRMGGEYALMATMPYDPSLN